MVSLVSFHFMFKFNQHFCCCYSLNQIPEKRILVDNCSWISHAG